PDHRDASDHAGSVSISDQRLLLLPVRSLKGTFAWVTSPLILLRLRRDCENATVPGIPDASSIPVPDSEETCLVPNGESALLLKGKSIVLEDLDLSARPDPKTARWAVWLAEQVFPGDEAWQQMIRARLCVVHDDVLSFLLDTATEVFSRVRLLDDVKTVADGGLWYEEALPSETILSGLVSAVPVRAQPAEVFEVIRGLVSKPMQLGGDATTGRGLCRLRMVEVG
ncbi:MAG: type III-B CRISPR module RAMP protein Cmr4, partial [Bacillota bacterium]